MKTYTSVLSNKTRKRTDSNISNAIALSSPQDGDQNIRSDNAKSSLTSSTTTHTNNGRKRKNSDKNGKKVKTNRFGSGYMRNQNYTKIKNFMSTTSKYTKFRPHVYNYNGDENMTLDCENLKFPQDLYAEALNTQNRSYDENDKSRNEVHTTKSKNNSLFKQRSSFSKKKNGPVNTSLISQFSSKVIKKNPNVRKNVLKIKSKKTNISDLKQVQMQHNMSATYDDNSSKLKDLISYNKHNENPIKKRLVKIKSSNELKTSNKTHNSSFKKRKTSCGPISTSKLCHLPTKDVSKPQTSKTSIIYGNYGARLRHAMYENKSKFKNSKSKSYMNLSKILDRTNDSKRSMKNTTRSISKNKIKKITSTRQPSKPNDVKFEPSIEHEGTSFNSLKTSIKSKLSPSNATQNVKKSPYSYIKGRKFSIQLDLYAAKSDNKKSEDLQWVDFEWRWFTDSKEKSALKDKVTELRRSAEKSKKSQVKNYANMSRFALKNFKENTLASMNKANNETSDNIRKQLDFEMESLENRLLKSDDEELNRNSQALNTDRTQSDANDKLYVGKAPTTYSEKVEIQNSAPQNKSSELSNKLKDDKNTLLINQLDPKTSRDELEYRLRPYSSKEVAKSDKNCAIKTQSKRDDLGQSWKSSINLTSHYSYTLSNSQHEYNRDSVDSKQRLEKSNNSGLDIPKFAFANDHYFKSSNHTLEYSDDDEQIEDEEAISIADMNNTMKMQEKAKLNNHNYLSVKNKNVDNNLHMKDKILVQQNYMDELRQSEEQKYWESGKFDGTATKKSNELSNSNWLSLQYANKHNSTEESKGGKVRYTEPIELDDPEDFAQNDDVQLNVNIPTQNTMDVGYHQSFFDNSHSGK